MPSKSVAATSAETGPGTTSQISAITSLIGRPVLAISDGIGGDAVEQAGGGEFTDFADIGGIDEELHGIPPETSAWTARPHWRSPLCGLSFSRNRGHRQPVPVHRPRRFAKIVTRRIDRLRAGAGARWPRPIPIARRPDRADPAISSACRSAPREVDRRRLGRPAGPDGRPQPPAADHRQARGAAADARKSAASSIGWRTTR